MSLKSECTLRVGLYRVLTARSADPSRTLLRLLCNLSCSPAFDREWFHHLANRSQLHAFSQGRAFLCLVVYAYSIGNRRTETCGRKKKKNTDGSASAFRKRLAFLALPWSVMEESTDSWAPEGKWKFFGGSAHCIERCFHSRESLLLRLDKGN